MGITGETPNWLESIRVAEEDAENRNTLISIIIIIKEGFDASDEEINRAIKSLWQFGWNNIVTSGQTITLSKTIPGSAADPETLRNLILSNLKK